MKLIVFLGNPGTQYVANRHNVGWMFADYLKDKWQLADFREDKKFSGVITTTDFEGQRILLLKPTTFMNRSGKAVVAVAQFYKIAVADILAIYDDKDIAFGSVRFREKGSHGGHNGIKDIMLLLGTDEIARIKIGVDDPIRQEHDIATSDFVLADFSKEQKELLPTEIFPQALDKLLQWILPVPEKITPKDALDENNSE